MPPVLLTGICASHSHPGWWSSGDPAEREAAQHLCGTCPALHPCRAWALALPPGSDLATILGGTTPEDRALVRRARQRALRRVTAA